MNLKTFPEWFLPKTRKSKPKAFKNLVNTVIIIKVFPGIKEIVMSAIFTISQLKRIVLETNRAGNDPITDWFLSLLKKPITSGLLIINLTQYSIGSVTMGKHDISTVMKEIGVITGKDITIKALFTKLMCLLDQKISRDDFRKQFEISLRGEMV